MEEEPVRVFIRIRPEFDESSGSPLKVNVNGTWSTKAITSSNNVCVSAVDEKQVRLIPPDGVYGVRKNISSVDDKVFTFDKIFRETCTQDDIYDVVAAHVLATVRGYNSTIFAYGTTGSGKSYTMTGNKIDPGIIPRAIDAIFKEIENITSQEKEMFFLVRLSYVELYNNNFRNLLADVSKGISDAEKNRVITNPNNAVSISELLHSRDDLETSFYDTDQGPSFASARAHSGMLFKQPTGYAQRLEKIEVREDSNRGVYLKGSNLRICVTSAHEAFQYVSKGNKVRATNATHCNDTSSRSHAILTFHVESKLNTEGPTSRAELTLGKLHLVDLAGSERLSMSEAVGERLEETKNINSSLSALGDVLSALASNAAALNHYNHSHSRSTTPNKRGPPVQAPVPYRNSKLTHLLRDALGGNSRTVMITNVRTGSEYFSQTQVSLDWSARARTIRNKSLVNRNVVGDTGIQQVNSEMERLMKRIDERTIEFEKLKAQQMAEKKENLGLKNRLRELQLTNDQERQLLESQVSQVIHSQAGHIQSQRQKISLLQTALQDELTMSQNVIAEQEKEIRWLQEELEKSAASAIDTDKLVNMKKVSDHWENRARATHQELSQVLQQAEELRSLNVIMTQKVRDLENSRQEVLDEANDRTQESVELANSLTRSLLEKQETEKALADTKSELKGTLKTFLEREKELLHRVTTLEEEIRQTRHSHDNEKLQAQQYTTQLSKRLGDMEKDKAELAARLTTTIGAIEKKTTQVVEDANQKIAHKESQLKDAEIQSQMMNGEVNHLKSMLTELEDMSQLKIASKDKTIFDLETALNKELQFSSQQEAKLVAMEGMVDGFRDKINKLKLRVKELETVAIATAEKHTAEQTEWVRELNNAKASKEIEREALMDEFERILQAKKEEFHSELESALNDWNELKDADEAAHQKEIEALHREFQLKEDDFRLKLAETEQKVGAMIESEINQGIRQLEAKHKLVVDSLQTEQAKQLLDALAKQRSEFEVELAERLTQAASDHEQEKQAALADLQEQLLSRLESFETQYESQHSQSMEALRSEHESQLTEALEQQRMEFERLLDEKSSTTTELRKSHEKSLSELKNQLYVNHQNELAALRIEHENEMSQSLQRETERFEKEKVLALSELQQTCNDEFDVIESKYRRQIEDLQNLVAKQRSELELSHQTQVESLTTSHKEYQLQMEFKVSQFKASSEERAETAIAEHSQRVEEEYRRRHDDLTRREKELIRLHEETLQSVEEKCSLDITKSLAKERARLSELHTKELEMREADAKSTLERAVSSMESKHQEDLLVNVEAERTKLTEQFHHKLQVTEEKFRQLLKEQLMTLKHDLESQHVSETTALRNKLASEQSKLDLELHSTHAAELERLNVRHRKEIEELRRNLESGLQSTQEEKDRDISQLRSELTLLTIQSREDVTKALEVQRKELTDKHRAEIERFRSDKHEAESRHQEEMTTLVANHVADVARQRKQLDSTHNNLVESLHAELASAKERLNQALSLVATKEGESSQTTLELKLRHDEQVRVLLRERDDQHSMEISALESSREQETQLLRANIEKLRTRLVNELEVRDSEHREELDRVVSALREKHSKDTADTRQRHEEALELQLSELTQRHNNELALLREEHRVLEARSATSVREAENRVKELVESSLKLSAQHEADKAKLFEDTKQRLVRVESRHHIETTTMETALQELERSLKAKFKEQQQQLKNESDAELQRQSDEAKSVLIRRDELFQKEISALKNGFTRREAEFQAETETLESALSELKRKNSALLDSIKDKQNQFDDEKFAIRSQHEEALKTVVIQHKSELQRVTVDLSARHSDEMSRLESTLEKLKQDFRAQHQQVVNQSQQSREEVVVTYQNQIAETQELLLSERQKVTQLKQFHMQEIQVLREQFEDEKQGLIRANEEALRNKSQSSSSEVERVVNELKEKHNLELLDYQTRFESDKQLLQQQISTLSTQHKIALKAAEDQWREELDSITFEFEKEKGVSRRLKEMHATRIKDLEMQFDEERRTMQQSHENNLRSEGIRKEAELNRLKEMHILETEDTQHAFDAKMKYLQNRILLLEQDAQSQVKNVELISREQLTSLTAQLNVERATLAQKEEEHRVAFAVRETTHQEQLASLTRENSLQLQQMKEQMESLRVEHAAEIQTQLKTLKESFSLEQQSLIDKLASELSQAKNVNDRLSREMERQLAESQTALDILRVDFELKTSQHAEEIAHLREISRKDIETERTRLSETYNSTIQLAYENAKRELALQAEDLQAQHTRELELCRSQNRAEMEALCDVHEREMLELQRRTDDHSSEYRDLRRQIAKGDAQREALQQEIENLRSERHDMLDNMHKLEVEIIEHGKAKFDARMLGERDKIDQSYKSAFSEVQAEVSARVEENKALVAKMNQYEIELASVRAVVKYGEEERERLESTFKSVLSDREVAHEGELRRALEAQHEELQGGYLKLIQQQVDSLMVLIQKQATQHSSSQQVEDLQNRFMSLVQDLPDLWKQKHGMYASSNQNPTSPSSPPSTPSRGRVPSSPAKTPLFVLAGHVNNTNGGYHHDDGFESEQQQHGKSRLGKPSVPWSSPALRSSPTDQLIAAILDGDVQGIRAVVRSRGEDLTAEFWKDLSKTVLPLHRAISGLHFHGDERKLIATIDTLTQLGADVNSADHAGNTVLHKAIQVCTSKNIASAVQTLLMRGANASTRNKDGDTPLHSECKRVRQASVEVIAALIAANADPNSRNQHNYAVTPLTLVLLRGASSTATGASLIGKGDESAFGVSVMAGRGLDMSFDGTSSESPFEHESARKNGHSLLHGTNGHNPQQMSISDKERANQTARRVWIRAAEMLVKSGAVWDPAWRTPSTGCSQLHLFLAAFPPTRDDSTMYRALLKNALEQGMNATAEDSLGRNTLFVLCEQMSCIPADACPDAYKIVNIVLEACGSGVGGSDRTGRTVFDIEEHVSHSCLSACRQILLDSARVHDVVPRNTSKLRPPPPSSHYQPMNRNANSSLNSRSEEWEFERPKLPVANNSVNRYSIDAKRKIVSNSSTVSVDHSVRSNGNSSVTSHSLRHQQQQHESSYRVNGAKRPSTASSSNGGGQQSNYFDDLDGGEEDEDATPNSIYSRNSSASVRNGSATPSLHTPNSGYYPGHQQH